MVFMAYLDLKYLGLDDAQIQALKQACYAQHPRGGMQTAMGCVCGSGGGGPAGSMACRALSSLMDAGKEARLGRSPRRDKSVCDHQDRGVLKLWEYQGKTLCELCSEEV